MGRAHGALFEVMSVGIIPRTYISPMRPSGIMIIALSGTPGVGKRAVSSILSTRGRGVVEISKLIREKGLTGDYDADRDTYEVDLDLLDREVTGMGSEGDVIMEGHLSHLLSVGLTVVLRCSPSLLGQRMRSRGWSESKIRENMEAEACDVILIEALDSGVEVCELDTTLLTPEEVADALEEIVHGEREKYAPGNIDWSEEVLDWF